MKLHYSTILLFSLPLNILSYNKNKPYITTHTPTTTSRVLIECNIYIPNYDYDPDMKSVKKIFHKQTEQRFHEYDRRMIKNRQKCKEECDKEIQKIILKDKMGKSLVEKVEKGCLKCGCGLGGVATGIGVLGTAVVNEWTKVATATAVNLAIEEGIKEGIQTVITQIKANSFMSKLSFELWSKFINESNYTSFSGLVNAINNAVTKTGEACPANGGLMDRVCNGLSQAHEWFPSVVKEGIRTTTSTIKSVKTAQLGEVNAASIQLYSAITYSVVAILVIVLVMVIIYLILRYRRKKKMNKRQQYTKLLNQ
ncbi:PIR protein, putative [Plasmodium sp. gorilla clade G1]|nr:PIR protein, putative [Plasmodium sp. gorilla clade G1]